MPHNDLMLLGAVVDRTFGAISVRAFFRDISKTRPQDRFVVQVIASIVFGVVLAVGTSLVAGFAFDLLGVR